MNQQINQVEVALVAGAFGGLGADFARQLAAFGAAWTDSMGHFELV